MIIGQKRLLATLDKYSLSTFPHSVILYGKEGSGKHLVYDYIINKFNIESVIINKDSDILEIIADSIQEASIKFYLVEADFLSEKNQNALLKFAEEPTSNCYIVILSSNLNLIIPTLKGRCFIFSLDSYSKEELSAFTTDPILLQVCETPGQIAELSRFNITGLLNELNSVYEKIKNLALPIIFQLSAKIGFKDTEKDKLSYKYFKSVLIYVIINRVKSNPSLENFKAYLLTKKFYDDCSLQCDKKRLYEKFLLELKEI